MLVPVDGILQVSPGFLPYFESRDSVCSHPQNIWQQTITGVQSIEGMYDDR